MYPRTQTDKLQPISPLCPDDCRTHALCSTCFRCSAISTTVEQQPGFRSVQIGWNALDCLTPAVGASLSPSVHSVFRIVFQLIELVLQTSTSGVLSLQVTLQLVLPMEPVTVHILVPWSVSQSASARTILRILEDLSECTYILRICTSFLQIHENLSDPSESARIQCTTPPGCF